MVVTKANLASYIAGLTPRETPYPIEITETIATDWGDSYTPGTIGNILSGTPAGVYIDLSGSVIPNGVINMNSTFFNCTALVNAPVIPNNVINMNSTFSNCTALVNAPVIPNNVINMNSTFYNCTALVNAPVIPNSVIHMDSTFTNCTALVNAPVIPNNVINMNRTFYNCTALVNAPVIPNSVIHMDSTFTNCTALVNAPVIPNNVINMNRTFYNCTALENAPVIPNSVTSMTSTFSHCTSLVSAPVITNGVINMDATFYDCTSLENAPVIPNSVINMTTTFYNCTALKTIGSFLVDVANCDMTNAFSFCPALEAIYVPAQEVDDWYLLYTDTKATGTDYYTYNTAGTLLSSGTVAGTNQVLSVYGKSDELVISNILTPERAIEAATTRLQHHKIGLSYNEESFVLNAKNPDNVICNFLDKYATKAFVKAQSLAAIYPIGCYYTQYPAANSNDDETEFPVAQRPATLFGGTWEEQWPTESIFFRTRGTLSDAGRTNGKQEDQMQGHWHDIWGVTLSGDALDGFTNERKNSGSLQTVKSATSSRTIKTDGTNGEPRTGTETRSVNRRIKVWKRTA